MSQRVKICGIKTAAIMRAAVDAGAEYVGVVFFPKSPRYVALAHAKELAAITAGKTCVVALMVDPTDDEAAEVCKALKPSYLQLQGEESPDRVRAIREIVETPIIKAIAVRTKIDAARAIEYRGCVDLILFDAKPPLGSVLPGGNGQSFDWTVLADMRREFPFMLGGGLTPANVRAAIDTCDPMIVDVSSGVETAPGVKDAGLIRAFIAAAKSTHRAAG